MPIEIEDDAEDGGPARSFPVRNLFYAQLDTLRTSSSRLAAAVERQADASDARVWPKVCAPVAFLTLGADVDGSFNLRSHIGKFLVAAVGFEGFPERHPAPPKAPKNWQPGLWQLVPPPKSNPNKLIGREEFVANCLELQKRTNRDLPDFCIPDEITDDDFGRFYDCAPALLSLVRESAECVEQSADTAPEESAA